jgi:hypothetical protein
MTFVLMQKKLLLFLPVAPDAKKTSVVRFATPQATSSKLVANV